MKRLIILLMMALLITACSDDDDDNDNNNAPYGVNNAPIAVAGPDQNVATGAIVTLDSSGSSDADGDALTYAWSFASIPPGSSAVLSDSTAARPTFIADMDGDYVISLVVNDGTIESSADTVLIKALSGNIAPIANAGPDQSVARGALVTLNSSGSNDANGDPLTYAWSFTSLPPGSSAVLSSSTAAQPTFIADVDGDYVISLIVNDGTVNSTPDSVIITVRTLVSFAGNIQPIFNANCIGCHSSGGIASFMSLGPASSYGNLVNVPAARSAGTRVIPGNSANSVLNLRISGTSVGAQMPLGGTPLSAGDQGLIRQWIDEGAMNN